MSEVVDKQDDGEGGIVMSEELPPYPERTPEQREKGSRALALRTRCFSALAPVTRFRCRGCGRFRDIEDRRRQVVFHFVDMCPECCRRGGGRRNDSR